MSLLRQIPFRSFVFLTLTLAVAVSARAAETYLKVIPGTALAWGAVNHMKDAGDKVQKLAGVVQVPAGNLLDSLKKESGLEKGIEENGAAGFFTLKGKDEKGATIDAIFVAVADEKEFLGNFDVVKAGEKINEVKSKSNGPRVMCLAFRGGYALLAPQDNRAAIEAALDSKQDIAGEMAGLESWIAENDGVVVGTAAGIKFAAKAATEGLKKSTEGAATAPEMAPLRVYLDFYGKAMQAAPSELSLALAGIRCDKQGSISILGRARLVSGGTIAKAIEGIAPVKENPLAGLPGGPFVIAAGGLGIPKLADAYQELATGFMKSMKSLYGLSAEDVERMNKDSFAVFREVQSMNFVMKSGKRGDPIYSNMFCTMRVVDSQHVLELQEKYAAKTSKLLQNAKEGMMKSLNVKRLEIGGKPAMQTEVNFDLAAMPGAEANRAALEMMMGLSGTMVTYFVAADEHTILMGLGVSQERMAAALDLLKQPRKSLAEDSDVMVTAGMLPRDAQWAIYVSPRGYMQLTQRLMSAALKNQPEAEGLVLPQFAKCPPLGIALKAAPAELSVEIAVPSALIQAGGDYVKAMQAMIMNRLMQQQQAPAP